MRGPDGVHHSSWPLARYDTAGALGPGFGSGGVLTVSDDAASGRSVAEDADGTISALGNVAGGVELRRLTATGTPDPGFAGGNAIPIGQPPVDGLLARADGSVDVLGGTAAAPVLARVRPDGSADSGFGSGGGVALPAPGFDVGPTLLAGPNGEDVLVTGITGDGGPAVQLADDSVVLAGGVGVVRGTGEATGTESDRGAVAVLGADDRPETGFGPASPAPALKLRVSAQRAATAARRGTLRLAVRSSDIGVDHRRARVGGRVVADVLVAALQAGGQELDPVLTAAGRRVLHGRRHVTIRVSATYQSLTGADATAHACGTLG